VTDAQRGQCLGGTKPNDRCVSTIPTACQDEWAGLVADDGDSFTIPAQSSVMIYVSRYFDATTDTQFQLTVRTEP
jgi:hypothetical protein